MIIKFLKRFFHINVTRLRNESPEQQPLASTTKGTVIAGSPSGDAIRTSSRLERFLNKEKQNLLENEHQTLQVFF